MCLTDKKKYYNYHFIYTFGVVNTLNILTRGQTDHILRANYAVVKQGGRETLVK